MTCNFTASAAARCGASFRCAAVAFFVLTLGWLAGASTCRAQEEKTEIPEPDDKLVLETKDGLQMKCTWYAGTRGKNTVPILMLHGLGGNRHEYAPLAAYLQSAGHAVLVPDLRGHGGSTKFKAGGDPLKVEDLKPAHFQAMMTYDIEACKSFIKERHNEGELNLELLCVVGADMSTVLSLNWAVFDWSWQDTLIEKRGRDVKALILLSPETKIEKTTINTLNPLKNPVVLGKGAPVRLSIMIAVGKLEPKAMSEAKKIHDPLRRARPEPPKEETAKKLDLFFDTYETTLQGTKLLDPKFKLGIEKRILNFIQLRLANKQGDYKWESRKQPE